MKQLLKQFFYKTRRVFAAALCVILCIQAVEPLGATIAKLVGEENRHIEILDAPGVDRTLFEHMDLYVEQRGEIFALDLEFEVAANQVTTEMESESSEEQTSEPESHTLENVTSELESATSELESATSESTVAESATSEPESMMPESTQEPTSKELEIEQIIYELESVYGQGETGEVQILEKTGMEDVQFEVAFSNAFFLLESAGDYHVLNEDGKPMGSFALSEEGEKILLNVAFQVPVGRKESVTGSIHFSMGNTSGTQGNLTLLWDAETEVVDVEIQETWVGGLVGKLSLRDMKSYTPRTGATPETSKSVSFDLMNQLPPKTTRMYDSLGLKMDVPRATANNVTDTGISVRIDAVMKNSFLADELASVEDEILEWLDQPGNADKGIDGWLIENDSGMEDIKFSIEFEDTEDDPSTVDVNEALLFDVATGGNSSDITINGQKYGTCTLSRDNPNKKVILTCQLSKQLYGMKNVTFGANFSLNAKMELQAKEVPTFQMSDGKIKCSGRLLHFLDSEPSDQNPYTLVKTIEGDATKSSDTPYVTFKVEVDAYTTLADSTIVDELPSELQLCGLRLQCDQDPEKTLATGEYTYANQVIAYKFPTGSTAKKAILYVDAILTPKKVFEMSNGATEADQTATFTNKAYLKDKADQKVDKTEDSVSGKKRFQLFQKSGKQNETNGSLLDWTIDIDVSFQGSIDLYLVDSLNPTTHDYLDGGTLMIESGRIEKGVFVKEKTVNVPIQKVLTSETSIDYENVSAQTLKSITGNNVDRAYVYKSANDEHVMAFNLANHIEGNEKHLRVTYSTKITGLDNQAGADGKKEFRNYADLRWKSLSWGNGPGTGAADLNLNYTINKPVEASVNVAVKRAGAYKEKTQLQTWNFDVNHYGMAYQDLIITEDFTNSLDQSIPDASGNDWLCSITEVHKGSGFTAKPIPAGSDGDTKPYYTKTGPKVTIHLGDVAETDYFTIAFNTKVGGAALTGNTKEYSLKNIATISTKNAGTTVEKATSDETRIPNTLLTKDALLPNGTISDGVVNGYDSATGELHWRIAINPNSLKIQGGIITDTLPIAKSQPTEHNSFGRITKVTYGSGNDKKHTNNDKVNKYTGEIGEKTIQIGDSAVYLTIDKTTDGTKTTFSIVDSTGAPKEIDQPLVVEFSTKLDETLVKTLFQDVRGQQNKTQGTFVEMYQNEASLGGIIVDSVNATGTNAIDPAKAKDDASHSIAIRGMRKNGTYGGTKGVGVISWDAIINEAHSTIGGLRLTDTLSPQVEYKKDSLELWKITAFHSDGSVKEKVQVTDLKGEYHFNEIKDTQGNTTGFELQFPGTDTNAYFLSFDTLMVEDAKPSDIKNELALHDGIDQKLVSNQADGGSDQQFYVDDYATGTKVPMLLLEKVSSSKDDYGKYQIKFKDVSFQIFQMKRNASLTTGWEQKTEIKTKITNEKGRNMFLDIEAGHIFQVVEKNQPVGYTKMTDKFVYFKTEEEKGKNGATAKTDEELRTLIKASSDVPDTTKDQDIYLVNTLYKRLILENTPDGATNIGKVEFQKENEIGTPLEGVKYQLKHNKGWVATKEATSNSTGKVSFSNVDPASGDEYYTLTERSTIKPYHLDETSYKVEVMKDGSYTVNGKPPSSFQNKLATADLEILKKDGVTQEALAGATYTLTGTDYLGRAVTASIGTTPFTTDASGNVTIKGIPVNQEGGYYTLTETVYPKGYQQSSNKSIIYRVSVTSKEVTVGAGKDYKAEISITKESADSPEVSAGAAKVTLVNTPVVGSITFTKMGEIQGTKAPLGGVSFGLYSDAACTKFAKDSEGKDVVATSATTGDVGKVTFDKVYYGTYYIKERNSASRPKGYVISQEVAKVTVKETDIQATTGAITTYTFVTPVEQGEQDKLMNPIATAHTKIKKTNQNGEILPGVTFSIERYGDANTAEPTGNKYVPYPVGVSSEIEADAGGVVDFGKLIYGTYRIVETKIPPQYNLIVNQKPFYLKVGLETIKGVQTVKVVKYDEPPADPSTDNLTGGTVLSDTQGVFTIPMVNELKYGLIQLTKVAATKEVIGSDTTYSISASGGNGTSTNTIEGAVFNIYKASEVGSVYITLKTNAQGQFDFIASGSNQYAYTDVNTGRVKRLLLGDYYIQEQTAPTGYVIDTARYPFSLKEDNYSNIGKTDNTRFEWIKNTGLSEVWLNGKQDSTPYFVNEIVRGVVTLDKVKKDNLTIDPTAKIETAIFIVYTDETIPKAVASLKWNGTDKKYLLSNENPLPQHVTFTSENAEGIPYVVKHAITGAYELVAGKYFVDEAVTPKGYICEMDPSANGFDGRKKYQFLMNSNAEVVISNESAPHEQVFTNALGKQNLTIHKKVDVSGAKETAVTAAQKDPNGFQFTLTKVSTESGLDYATTSVAVSGGVAAFTDIPYGIYTLTEEKGSREGYVLMEAVTLKVSQEGITIQSDVTGRTDVVLNNTTQVPTLNVTNTLVTGNITGIKYGDTGNDYGGQQVKLGGAKFALYGEQACTTEICQADDITNQKGEFAFSKIPYGTYWIKEIEAPSGYELSNQVEEVKIKEHGKEVSIDQTKFKNILKKATLTVPKTDRQTNAPVSGAVFSVFGKKGEIKDKVVAYFTESSTAGTYALNNQGEGKTVVPYTNGEGLPYLMYHSGSKQYYLSEGEYYYQETTTPDHYQQTSDSVDFTVAGTGAGAQVVINGITNTRKLTDVIFQKVDKSNGAANEFGQFVPYGIAGITFTLYSDAGCTSEVKRVISSGNTLGEKNTGTVNFSQLTPGTYYFKETDVPKLNGTDMYRISSAVYTFTVDTDVTNGLELPKITLVGDNGMGIQKIENVAEPLFEVKLTMDLKSKEGTPLPNALFRLFRNGVYYATVRTGPDGMVDFGKVLPAQYTLVQDTSVEQHIPILGSITIKVEDPQATGIDQYHIPVVNEKVKDEERKGSGSSSTSGFKPWSGNQKEETLILPLPTPPSVIERIVPDVIPSEMVLEKDLAKIKHFFENLEEESLTPEDLARKEQWGREFQKNGTYWREQFDMTKEEWEFWMKKNFGANYQKLPQTGGMIGTVVVALMGALFFLYGAYVTFGRRNKKWFKQKKK